MTGVGHARLILERFGKFWGAFSVVDLFILNALTLVTEFIGITLAAAYLGLPKIAAVLLAAAVVVGSAFTGSFRRFERIAIAFCGASLLLVPVYFLAHPGAAQMAHGFVVPQLPGGTGQLSTVMLLIIGIVGTTVAPWQLFFQQSYVIDKRITPRFMRYEKADLWIGIVIVVVGAAAVMGVSLSTAYAIGDVLGLRHSLHRGVRNAKGFYAVYGGLVAVAATIVLIPGSPPGLLTEGVQVLAGVLLPSASVFLLLLCNDRRVLGPWVNGRKTNLFTAAVVAVLVTLSVILTASVLFPAITAGQIMAVMVGCGAAASLAAGYVLVQRMRTAVPAQPQVACADRDSWRMPPLALLERPVMSTGRKLGMAALRLYVAAAMILVILKIVRLAIGH